MLIQISTFEDGLDFAGDILVLAMYFALFLFIRMHYLQSKRDGIPNHFSLGYAAFFCVLWIYHLIFLITYFWTPDNVPFSKFYNITPMYNPSFGKLDTPFYTTGVILIMLILAAQVYPLEDLLGWKKLPATKYLITVAILIMLIFIPALCYSPYSEVVWYFAICGVILGLTLNVGINIKLATTKGDLRKRSFSIIIASFMLYFGFLLTLKISEISLLNRLANLPIKYDVFVGMIVEIIGGMLYWRGLIPSFSGAVSFFKSRHVCIVHRGEIDGPVFMCGHCNAFYCERCKESIVQMENKCWNCGNILVKSLDVNVSIKTADPLYQSFLKLKQDLKQATNERTLTVLMNIGTRILAFDEAGALQSEVKGIIQEEIEHGLNAASSEAAIVKSEIEPSLIQESNAEGPPPTGVIAGKNLPKSSKMKAQDVGED